MWVKLRELGVGATFEISPNFRGKYTIQEILPYGIRLGGERLLPEHWDLWDWKRVDEQDKVWVEDEGPPKQMTIYKVLHARLESREIPERDWIEYEVSGWTETPEEAWEMARNRK